MFIKRVLTYSQSLPFDSKGYKSIMVNNEVWATFGFDDFGKSDDRRGWLGVVVGGADMSGGQLDLLVSKSSNRRLEIDHGETFI